MTPMRLTDVTPPALRRMRAVALALLVAMAALFLLSRAMAPLHLGWGYARAFAEAAMVGGLADWFAVTALFRHPLGLPIPHTAIVPRNKDRIGEQLAQFLRSNFLIPGVVARRMRRVDVAAAAGRWLANPRAGEGRLRHGLSRLAVQLLQSLDPERLGGMIRGAAAARLRETEVAPVLGQLLRAAIAQGRHAPLLDGAIRWAARALQANEGLVRQMVHERAGSILRWTGLDETVADKLIDGLDRLLVDMAERADHPIRLKAEEGLDRLAWDLQHDPEMRARVEQLKADLLDNPAVARWLEGLWEQAREALLRMARDPERVMSGRVGELLRQLGETLQREPRLGLTINRFVRRAAVGAAADYGDAIVRLVSETVRGWDTQTITRRLENAVGRDLQYIRVNGTLVGGLVGLVIHLIDRSL
jgi:uncharacterized membrane-anchored protein YjiN (DUF445 family)